MEIKDIIQVFQSSAGLSENQAKLATYYAMATHEITKFSKFPILVFRGPPGSGKTTSMDVMKQICNQPHWIACHDSMTLPVLRDSLDRRKGHITRLLEEADRYPNHKQLEGQLINGWSEDTAKIDVKAPDPRGKGWVTVTCDIFGPIVIHDRNSFNDLATESRSLTIETRLQPGPFPPVPAGLKCPPVSLGPIPSFIMPSGRAFDKWKPILMVASGCGDTEFLRWANAEIQNANKCLATGHQCEETQAIFGQVIEACFEAASMYNLAGARLPDRDYIIEVYGGIVKPLSKQMPGLSSQMVNKRLTGWGFSTRRSGGSLKLFTNLNQIKQVANQIGYEDDALQ